MPKENGFMKLKNSSGFYNVRLTCDVKGNQFGTQQICLRSDENAANCIAVVFMNNHLIVEEKAGGSPKKLADVDLFEFDGGKYHSVDEDKKEVAIKEREIFGRYASNTASARKQLKKLEAERGRKVFSVEEGGAPYIPTMSYHARMNRKLEIRLKDSELTVLLDGKSAVENLKIGQNNAGFLCLGAVWPGYGYSQANLADDVYDGVFAGLKVEELTADNNNLPVLYDVHYTGFEGFKRSVKHKWEAVLDWVLATF